MHMDTPYALAIWGLHLGDVVDKCASVLGSLQGVGHRPNSKLPLWRRNPAGQELRQVLNGGLVEGDCGRQLHAKLGTDRVAQLDSSDGIQAGLDQWLVL